MQLFSRPLVASLLLLLAGTACKVAHGPQAGSDVKYGFLANQSRRLVKVPSGSTIRICGDDTDSLGWAIATWGRALGRTYNVVVSCSSPDIKSFGATDPVARQECANANIDSGRGFARPDLYPQVIYNCAAWNSGRKFLLHEVGHLFGMCDQYQEALKNCVMKTQIDPSSVMAVADKEYLTDDDTTGIVALAADMGAPVAAGNGAGAGVGAGGGGGNVNGDGAGFRAFIGKRYRDSSGRTLWLNADRACSAKRGGGIQDCRWNYDNGTIEVAFGDGTVWYYRAESAASICFVPSVGASSAGRMGSYNP
jgi:hypothetical protein